MPSCDESAAAIVWSMLGPVALVPFLIVVPVQRAAIPASWEPPLAAITLRPSSTVTLLVRSALVGPALVNADSVSRKTSGLVTVAVEPVGAAPCAPHL